MQDFRRAAAVLDARVQYPQNVKTFYNNTFALSDMTVYPASGNYKDANVHRQSVVSDTKG